MISVDEINKLQADNKRLNDIIDSYQPRLEELKELKAENDRLKEENVKLLFGKGTLVEFCNKLTQIIDEKKESENKLLQTLQEIKKIAERQLLVTNVRTYQMVYYADFSEYRNEILQKITKAEEE